MKALSLWQPWASLWAHGLKIHETRSWSTTYRGELAVHAAQKWTPQLRDLCWTDPAIRRALEHLVASYLQPHERTLDALRAWIQSPPRGGYVGVVTLDDVLPVERVKTTATDVGLGDYSAGRFAWRAWQPRVLCRTLPARGQQGLWTVADDVAAEIRARAISEPLW